MLLIQSIGDKIEKLYLNMLKGPLITFKRGYNASIKIKIANLIYKS